MRWLDRGTGCIVLGGWGGVGVICFVWVGVFVVLCFFKQKTAYEIVPRDWSSDVCSSDLLLTLFVAYNVEMA